MEQSPDVDKLESRKQTKGDAKHAGNNKRKATDDLTSTPTKKPYTDTSDATSPQPIYVVNLADTTTDEETGDEEQAGNEDADGGENEEEPEAEAEEDETGGVEEEADLEEDEVGHEEEEVGPEEDDEGAVEEAEADDQTDDADVEDNDNV